MFNEPVTSHSHYLDFVKIFNKCIYGYDGLSGLLYLIKSRFDFGYDFARVHLALSNP